MDKKITSIGEVLVDWACLNRTLDLHKANEFIKLPGGAPANVSVGLAKLGYPIQFVGGFSDDIFGIWLKEHLLSLGVDVSKAQEIANSNTRCAYVLMDEDGNRVFKGFSRNLCADSMLDFEKIDLDAVKNSEIFYLGSLIQACEKSRATVNKLLQSIQNISMVKVYDPNLRLFLWKDLETAVEVIKDTIKYVDILKLSDDEINLISGIENDIEKAAEKVFADYENLKLLVVTAGPEGSYFINRHAKGFVKPFKVESVEMTGAGDGFVAGLIGGLYDYFKAGGKLEDLNENEMKEIMTRANAIGALATTRPGAMSALPVKEELEQFLATKV